MLLGYPSAIIVNFKCFGGTEYLTGYEKKTGYLTRYKKNPLKLLLLLVLMVTVIDATVCPKIMVCFCHKCDVCQFFSENNLNCCSLSYIRAELFSYNHSDFFVLDSEVCPKVTLLCFTILFYYHNNKTWFDLNGYFFSQDSRSGKKNIFSRFMIFNIIIDVMRCHKLIIFLAYIVTILHHHMIHVLVNFGSRLKVNCEQFQCELFLTLVTQLLYGGCNIGTVFDMYVIRHWTPAELRRKAQGQTLEQRRMEASSKSLILVPHVEGVWNGKEAPLTKEAMAVAVAGRPAPNLKRSKYRTTADNDHMAAWLKAMGPTRALTDPRLVPFEDMIPSSAPLIDFLCLDSERDDTWSCPSWDTVRKWRDNRSITSEWATKVSVKEFVIGSGSEDQFGSFKANFWRRYQRDQEEFQTGVISLDNESVPCTTYDVVRIAENPDAWIPLTTMKDDDRAIPVRNKPAKGDQGYQFPAKIMFGGSDWVHMISFNSMKDTQGRTCIKAGVIPQYVVDFLTELPVVTGAGIRSDMLDIEHVFSVITGKPMQLKGSIDLGVLAVLAGWQLSKTGMLPLAVITLGMMMNKVVSTADWKWARTWSELPLALQAYAVGDIKMGHLTYNVLMALLHRQLFPDPELVCRLSRCDQKQWTRWFTFMIRDTLVGTEIDALSIPAAIRSGSRTELMECIRIRDKDGAIPLEAPARIKFLAGLVVWPTLTMGGPRYLQCVRQKYLAQYNVLLKSSALPGMDEFFKHELTPMDRLDGLFGHEDVLLVNENAPIPEPGWLDFHFGLASHHELTKPLFVFRGYQEADFLLSLTRIRESAKLSLNERGLREAMLEWTRLSYNRSEDLFEAMQDNLPLAKWFRGWYEAFRLQYLRGTGRDPKPVAWIENSMEAELQEARRQAAYRLDVMLREVEVHKKFMGSLEQAESIPINQDRTSWKATPTAALWLRGDAKNGSDSESGEPVVKRVRLMGDIEAMKMDSQAVKLGRFVADEEVLTLSPLIQFRDTHECTDGGRRMNGRVKPAQVVQMNPVPSFGATVRRVVERGPSHLDTQDVWEEYKRPAVPEPFDEFEDFDEFMPSPPPLPFDLADQ